MFKRIKTKIKSNKNKSIKFFQYTGEVLRARKKGIKLSIEIKRDCKILFIKMLIFKYFSI